MSPDLQDLRTRLADWLRARLPAAQDLALSQLTPTPGGFSAQTLLFDAAYAENGAPRTRALVMRREMPGFPIFLDTDLRRQGEMMIALARHGVPTAPVVGIEEDDSVLGARFLVMDRAPGRPFPAHGYNAAGWFFDASPAMRAKIWANAVAMLGRINKLPWRDGFQMLDKPQYGPPGLDQFLGWLRAWRAQCAGGAPHPIIDPAMEFLAREKPATSHVDVLWGDSNPGNMMIADDGAIAAALDFEAAALGPGEIDLGWFLYMDGQRTQRGQRLAGVQGRDEMIAIYEAALGRRAENVHYYEVLGGVRMALVIVRTVDRFVETGDLPANSRAVIDNPIAGHLARLIDLPAPPVGADFADFVRVVSRR